MLFAKLRYLESSCARHLRCQLITLMPKWFSLFVPERFPVLKIAEFPITHCEDVGIFEYGRQYDLGTRQIPCSFPC